jgi:hypothetical protein
MAQDDDFHPRLGRIGNKGKGAGSASSGACWPPPIWPEAALAERLAEAAFSGAGSGAAAGWPGARQPGKYGAGHSRRVIVKASIVRLSGKGAAAAAAHLRYLQRDGTTRDGERGTLYGRDEDAVDAKAFQGRGAGDRHQFRFIVSPEDGDQYEDLKPLTRRLMERMEQDLGTKLDWVAVDHFNTGHPHTHIWCEEGRWRQGSGDCQGLYDQGLRERAIELVDLDLGPRTEREVETILRAEVEAERLTSIDRSLLRPPMPSVRSTLQGVMPSIRRCGQGVWPSWRDWVWPSRWTAPATGWQTIWRIRCGAWESVAISSGRCSAR